MNDHRLRNSSTDRRPKSRQTKPPIRPQAGKPLASATPTDWSDIAHWYDSLVGSAGSDYHQQVVLPGTLRLLNVTAGQRVLDVAEGQGVLGRLLASKGVRVTGVDASAELIAAARQHDAKLPPEHAALIEHRQLDAGRDLKQHLPEAAFDAAACVLAVGNMHPIAPVFHGVARALKPNGHFVIVVMHPCFRGHKESSWGWDDRSGTQYRRVDRYLLPRKAPIIAHPGRRQSQYTWSFHKPIELLVKPLRQAGLLIDTIEEWPSHKTSQPGPRQAAENQSRKEIPMFMAIRALRVAVPEHTANAEADG